MIILLGILGVTAFFLILIYGIGISEQKKDWKEYRHEGESYRRFCDRFYNRYL